MLSVQNGGVEATTHSIESNFTKKKGLMQIPNTQITLSGNVLDSECLDGKPGYMVI